MWWNVMFQIKLNHPCIAIAVAAVAVAVGVAVGIYSNNHSFSSLNPHPLFSISIISLYL